MTHLPDPWPARATGVAMFAVAVLGSLSLAGCQESEASAPNRFGGDVRQGAALIRQVGCGACHEVPGIQGAKGLVGPPLERISRRVYLAGMLRNTPDNMITWLRFPQSVVPGNAMPNMNLSETDARHIGAYLDTLK